MDGGYDADYFASRYEAGVVSEFQRTLADALCATYEPRTALDVGCGLGGLVAALGRHCEAHGVEGAPEAIARIPNPHSIQKVDLSRDLLPFDDASFDLITSIEVAEHIPVTQPWMSEICRVLKPGGRFFLQTPNPYSIAAKADPTHVNVRFRGQWAKEFRKLGLSVCRRELAAMEELLPIGHYGSKLPRWIRFSPALVWFNVWTGTRTIFSKPLEGPT